MINGPITINGDNSDFILGGSWQNTGGITLTNGSLTIGGETFLSELGTITRTGGTVNLAGTLNLEGGTLTLDNNTGPWRVNDGIIRNGTFVGSGLGTLSFAGQRDNRLDNMTINGNLILNETNSTFQIDNGLTLNGTVTMITRSGISYVGNETITGTGTIAFDATNTSRKEIEATEHDTTLTIGSNITLTGGRARIIGSLFFGRRGSLVNEGSIVADGGQIQIATTGGTFRNEGSGSTSEINGGTIVINNPAP